MGRIRPDCIPGDSMKIDFYCVGVCQNDGEPTQLAGCGVVVVFTDDYNRIKLRAYKYALGNSTQNLADLQAVRLAFASVRSPYRSATTHLHTNSVYVARMLKRDGKAFAEVPTEYQHEVQMVRQWFGYYDQIIVVAENPQIVTQTDENMLQAKDLADMGLITQEHADSGTLERFDSFDQRV